MTAFAVVTTIDGASDTLGCDEDDGEDDGAYNVVGPADVDGTLDGIALGYMQSNDPVTFKLSQPENAVGLVLLMRVDRRISSSPFWYTDIGIVATT